MEKATLPIKIEYFNPFSICKVNQCAKYVQSLTLKTPEQYQVGQSSVLAVNFEQISHPVLMFPILALNK